MKEHAKRVVAGSLGTASYWSSMTAQQLLRTSFTTNHPEALEGLVETIPDPAGGLPHVEYYYDFRGTKRDRVRCVHCGWHNHLAGYVIRTAEGQRFLVGHECGDKLYGADFETLKRDYDDAREYAFNLRRWQNLQAELPAFLDWLADLQKSEAVKTYRDAKLAFRAKLPRLYGAICAAILRDRGVLSIEDKLRDFEAENRAVDQHEREKKEWEELTVTERKNRRRYGDKGPQPPQLPMFKYVPQPVMTVRAADFFTDDFRPLPHEQLARALASFEQLANEIAGATLRNAAYEGRRDADLRESRHLFATTFDGVFSRMSAQLDVIKRAMDHVTEMEVFFRLDSLSTVVRWANAHRKIKDRFALSGRGIGSDDPSIAPVAIPAQFSLPSLERVEEFVRAVNATEPIR